MVMVKVTKKKSAKADELFDPVEVRVKEIADKHGGDLTPEMVVEDARDQRSPLHNRFEWDDEKAAHSHRIEQARKIIQSCTLVVRTEDAGVIRSVAYIRNPSVAANEQGYRSVLVVRDSKQQSRSSLQYELERLLGNVERLRSLAVVLDVQEDLEKVVEQIAAVIGRVSGMAA